MVFTGTRADFGLLRPAMELIDQHDRLDLKVVAGGSHFSPKFGHTVDEITEAGFDIDWKIETDIDVDSGRHIATATAQTLAAAADAADMLSPDIGLVLGDRYEALGFASACLLSRVPIAHVHGGEVTTGAVDDAIRNAITQMATLHFAAAEPFADRIVQMGASSDAVFVVGAPGLDTVKSVMADIDDPRSVLEEKTGVLAPAGPIFLVSFHPESRSPIDPGVVMQRIIDELLAVDDSTLVISAPNSDWGRNAIANVVDRAQAREADRVRVVASFGHRAYIAAMMAADVVVGNSSSGIIEAPLTGTPTVNIGDRQRGRPQAASVTQATTDGPDIARAVSASLSFTADAPAAPSLFGDGDASRQIVDRLLEYFDL